MKIILIIQARMGSSRLPGKVLLPLGKCTVLDYVVNRCSFIQGLSDIIVATSTEAKDDLIEAWCREREVPCYRGSEEDVLSRYYECAVKLAPDYVIRITGDCPFIDFDLGSKMVEAVKTFPCDIIRLSKELPRGLEPQLVSFRSLEYMYYHGKEKRHREHVTYFAYEYPEMFKSQTITIQDNLNYPRFRITLDTPEDYKLMQEIAKRFENKMEISSEKVVQFLLDNPPIANINAHIEQKPVI